MPATSQFDFMATPDEISELVRRIVADTDPLAVIAFGSRARGDNKVPDEIFGFHSQQAIESSSRPLSRPTASDTLLPMTSGSS